MSGSSSDDPSSDDPRNLPDVFYGPLSDDPVSDDEQPEADDETVSEVVRKPTRTAGDLSEAAGASAGITLEELLRRVQRIEELLGIGSTGSQATPIAKVINDLKASVRRLAQNISSSSVSSETDRQIEPATPRGPKSEPLPGRVGPPLLPKEDRPSKGKT